jgi:hypothetical protein
MDPFDEFARAVAADNPDKYTVTSRAKHEIPCPKCGAALGTEAEMTAPGDLYPETDDGISYWVCGKCYKELQDSKKDKKKSKKEEFEEYEKKYLGRLELATEEIEKARTEIEITDDNVEVNRTKPRKVSDIHKLTREEVEKARAEIEIIKIREPNRKSQKIIPTQATILNAGNQDYYVIFGIDQHITCDELKEQFRKLSVKYNSSIGMLSRTKEENEIIGKVHTRINQAYRELAKTHQC